MTDALQTFLILITDLKHLSAVHVRGLCGEEKKIHDGTKRGWGDEMKWRGKKRQRKGNGEG